MNESEVESCNLDPFGFLPGVASRILPLRHEGERPDDSYVFHTEYVPVGEGPLSFTLTFDHLKASSGTLAVSLNAYSEKNGTVRVLTEEIDLPNLAGQGSPSLVFRLEARKHTRYALLGYCYGMTDAVAQGLTITLERVSERADYARRLVESRAAIFTVPGVEQSASSLVCNRPARLAQPVSQMCTVSQFEEPEYKFWCDKMRIKPIYHRKYWELAYILQTLKCNGMLAPGKVGLGFGVGTEPIPAILASMGCRVVATDLPEGDSRAAGWTATNQHVAAVDALFHEGICETDVLRANCEFMPVDMNAIPDDLNGFDFTWSSCAFEHVGSIEKGLKFVEESIKRLRQGGIAVHTTELNLTSNEHTIDNADTVLFRRKDFEEIAMRLISQGHEVEPLNFDQGGNQLDQYIDMPPYSLDNHLKLVLGEFVTTSFGIVVRRGNDERAFTHLQDKSQKTYTTAPVRLSTP